MKTFQAGGLIALGLVAALAACTPNKSSSPAEVEIRGTDPNQALSRTGSNTLNNSVVAGADSDGIITYDGYQTAQARSGDTVESVAARIGLSATQLGAYNGLPTSYALQEGDELALPPRPGGYGSGGAQSSNSQPAQVIASTSPAANTPAAGAQAGNIEQRPIDSGGIEVNEDGTLVTQDAAATASTETAAAASAGQPAGTWSPSLAAAAIARSNSGINDDGSLGAPPSAGQPVPPEAEQRNLESPDLSQYQTEESGAIVPLPPNAPEAPALDDTRIAALENSAPVPADQRMRRPVEGPVAIGFNKGSGPTHNDGVDFAAPAGAKVVAAADGEVALVSQSLGGLGTIVLIRHPNELLTVYGRIDGVLVNKGDLVRAGQQIGIVSNAAAPEEPRMHFEVRRGSESLDPMRFL